MLLLNNHYQKIFCQLKKIPYCFCASDMDICCILSGFLFDQYPNLCLPQSFCKMSSATVKGQKIKTGQIVSTRCFSIPLLHPICTLYSVILMFVQHWLTSFLYTLFKSVVQNLSVILLHMSIGPCIILYTTLLVSLMRCGVFLCMRIVIVLYLVKI